MAEEPDFTPRQRRRYLSMLDRVGENWVEVFDGNTEFYSSAYWDLLTEVWRVDSPVRKTDALRFMKAIKSAHTAGKYIEEAVRVGILIESDNPEDARSRLLTLSDAMRERLDRFFDKTLSEVLATAHEIGAERDGSAGG